MAITKSEITPVEYDEYVEMAVIALSLFRKLYCESRTNKYPGFRCPDCVFAEDPYCRVKMFLRDYEKTIKGR